MSNDDTIIDTVQAAVVHDITELLDALILEMDSNKEPREATGVAIAVRRIKLRYPEPKDPR